MTASGVPMNHNLTLANKRKVIIDKQIQNLNINKCLTAVKKQLCCGKQSLRYIRIDFCIY